MRVSVSDGQSSCTYQQVVKALSRDKGGGGEQRPLLIMQQSTCGGVTTEQFPCLVRRLGKDDEEKDIFILC